jgi:hypothetical protein
MNKSYLKFTSPITGKTFLVPDYSKWTREERIADLQNVIRSALEYVHERDGQGHA